MKRLILIVILPIVLGIVGAFFRARELAFGFDFESGLPYGNLVATAVLIGIGILILLAALGLTCRKQFLQNEEKKHPAYTTIAFVGCALMLALAAIHFTSEPIPTTITYIHCVLTLLCAASFAILGIKRLRANQNPVYSFFTVIPVFWACFSLIIIFRERIADPIIADYIFLLFAFISILMFLYAQAGYVYCKNRFAVAVSTAVFGAYCCVIEAASPVIAAKLLSTYPLALDFTTLIPLVFFAIYMPIATLCIVKNENNI